MAKQRQARLQVSGYAHGEASEAMGTYEQQQQARTPVRAAKVVRFV